MYAEHCHNEVKDFSLFSLKIVTLVSGKFLVKIIIFICLVVTWHIDIPQNSYNFRSKFMLLVPLVREGNGARLGYTCLENPMDRAAW